MIRKTISFTSRGQHGRAPRMNSRASGIHFATTAYKTDGIPGDDDEARKALLTQIQTRVKEELDSRGYLNKEAVEGLATRMLEGLPLDALKKYEDNKTAIETSVRNISGELEKIKNVSINVAVPSVDMVRRTLEQEWLKPGENGAPSQMEMLWRKKGTNAEISMKLRVAATMTTTNTIDEDSYDLGMIESVNLLDEVMKKRRGTEYIFQIADRTTVSEIEEYTSWLEEGSEQGAFAIVAEGAVKPLVSTALVRNFAKAKKVAGKMVVTEEFTKWRKKAWTAIQSLLRDKIIRDYSALLLVDLQAQAASYVGTTLDDTISATDMTDYHAIGAVAAQIETLNFAPDLLIIHPQDKWRLALQQDTNGQFYMMIPMMGADGVTRMMGFRVITSTFQTIGTFTLGESGLFKIEDEPVTARLGYGIDVTTGLADSGAGTVTVVTAAASDFDTNKLRLILELFFKDWIATPHIGSFVTATFASVKAALLAP